MTTWIRRSTRLAILDRDGWRCVYCTVSVVTARRLTGARTRFAAHLDHVHPRSLGGDNTPYNIVTACKRCNEVKSDKPFVVLLATLKHVTGMHTRVNKALTTPINRANGRALAARGF